jgi:hypothetical protein
MDIREKVRRYRKHYKAGGEMEKKRLENLLKKEIDGREDSSILWASLIFDADIKPMTFGERKAAKTATNHKITCFTIGEGKIIPIDK